MKAEVVKVFSEIFDEYLVKEQDYMEKVLKFFETKIQNRLPEYTNLKLRDLSYWLYKNQELLIEEIGIEVDLDGLFDDFTSLYLDFGDEYLTENNVTREYIGSTSSFYYITPLLNGELLEELEKQELDWFWLENILYENFYHISFDVEDIKRKPSNVRLSLFEIFTDEYDEEGDLHDNTVLMEDMFEEMKFWEGFEFSLREPELLENIELVERMYQELETFKDYSIVNFLSYLINFIDNTEDDDEKAAKQIKALTKLEEKERRLADGKNSTAA